jgi:peptidyl-prolyl cis-trans isomerase A (cyclophilin A)/peptidyl-prolyl cis-trans isomerase B (cyclophilin B)
MDPTRRTLLAAATATAALLAGCSRADDGDDSRQSFATPTRRTGMSDNPTVTLGTNHGEITIELFAERAPRTVENFLGLARHDPAADAEPAPDTNTWTDPETGEVRGDSLYEGTVFHRIIEGFMIQGGDPTGTGRGGPGYEFDDEFHPELRHDGAGDVSMANSGPDTNGSQFFVTLDAQPHLDDRHAVFGEVLEGMDVVRDVGDVPTDRNDQPEQEVVVENVEVDE